MAAKQLPFAEIALVVRCAAPSRSSECPSAAAWSALGVSLPLVALAPFEESATAKLDRALGVLDSTDNRRIKRRAPAESSPDAGGVP